LHARQGEAFATKREYAKAIDEYRRAIRLNSRSADYYDGLGNAYNRLGQYAAACKAFSKAIGLDPQNPYFHNNLGETHVLQGNLAGAQREFLRRIQLHPDDAFAARTSLGVILIHEGQVDEGRRQLLAALRIYSQRAPRQDVMTADAYFMNRALALAGLGDPDSVAVWQEAISRRQIPAEDLADWKRYIDLLKTAPQPPAPVASITELLEVAGTTRPAQ